ncbi:FAD/NAD(P)-binding protein [Streptomyces sp. UNOC14_S4]|uniref:FAD/NAD(P)-binding protein n=1 Tax=Streptomyces sp. UNOC14_S4 TaxID=2872340 RepID=UPI001E62592F|nr:FAD/NAD(P)-binding protein [Streptomyces sp. UNOC14_S4]
MAEAAAGWAEGGYGVGDRTGRDVVVIGAGVAGTSVVLHLVRALLAAREAGRSPVRSVQVVDPHPTGWGLAFGDTDPLLLCNTAVAINSLLADRPGDFVDHLRQRGWTGGENDCVPRSWMAEYCRDRYEWAREQAASLCVTVRHVRGTAASIDVGSHEDGVPRVRLTDGRVLRADRVVVCTGVRRPRTPDGFAGFEDHPRYLDSPYPAARLQRLPKGSRVLVLGSHLSAVDAALVLCRDGHRTTVTSPSGLLPAVRVSLAPPGRELPPLDRIARLDPADPLLERKLTRCAVEAIRLLDPRPLRLQISGAADPVERLREETALVEAGACGWAGMMVPVIEAVIALAPALPAARRRALMARFGWLTSRYATAMTIVNARRLLDCFDAGTLRMADGYPSAVTFAEGTWQVTGPCGEVERFDHVVNATGFHQPLLHWDPAGSTLLLDIADVPAEQAAPVDDLDGDLRVRRTGGAPPEHVWVVGVGTHVRTPFANHMRNVVRQARQVAEEMSTEEVSAKEEVPAAEDVSEEASEEVPEEEVPAVGAVVWSARYQGRCHPVTEPS